MADSTFEKLVGGNPVPERTATGFRFTEGPVFSRLGYLLFSDPPSGRIMKWEVGKISVFREKSNGARSLTFDHQGRLLACEQGRVTRTEKNGAVTVLADRCETVPLNHPNDVVYAIDGTIYFTDGNQDASVLCRIDRKGNVHTASSDCRTAHGVALAPNQQKLYVTDTGDPSIRVYDISGDGSLRNGRLFAEARSHGLKTDEEGNVWATDSDAITVFDSRGTKLGSIAMPENPSNCAWGEGFRGLYVTARSSIYKLPAKVNGTRTY